MSCLPGVDVDEASLAEVCERYGIARLLVFGSVARGTAKPDSDIDVLYELRPGRRLGWEIEQLADELAAVLGRPVDLVSSGRCTDGCGRRCSLRLGCSMRRELLLLEEMVQLPPDLKAESPEIPWQRPARLRNRIVHGYWSIDVDILLTTAADHLPALAEQLRGLHATLDQQPDVDPDSAEPAGNS